MNAQADEFNDSDSSYTPSRMVFRDSTANTAMPEYEWLRKVTGIHYLPYESNAPTGERSLIFQILGQRQYRVVSTIRNMKSLDLALMHLALPDSEFSTLPMEPPREELDWFSCLARFVDEEIEDGMTAALGETISNLVRLHGSKAIEQLEDLIRSNNLSPSLADHTLRWLGRIKDSTSFDSRLGVLCENLRSKSPVVRDGASLGLAALGSPKAIPHLQEAIKQEKLPGLRADMEQVLRQLQT
jgi:HEAT repeats